jgi:hypothetical protein
MSDSATTERPAGSCPRPARSPTFPGAVATVLIGNWVGEFDSDQAKCVLSGEDPFDEATMIDDEEAPKLAEHPLPGHPTASHQVSKARPPSD